MNILFPLALISGFIGFILLWIKSNKDAIRRYAKKKCWEVVDIKVCMSLVVRTLKYRVKYVDENGLQVEGYCHVSLFLGVVWEDESFLKWLVP